MRLRNVLLAVCITALCMQVSASSSKIEWRAWDASAFEQAQREHKLVFLDLVAVWCHWCHVMDAETYSNQAVAELLNNNFITVQADHDLRPDLAERYREWGWPATIILDANGNELLRHAGYIAPAKMLEMLQTVIEQPQVQRSAGALSQLSGSPLITPALRDTLEQNHLRAFDAELGGLKIGQKFVDRDSVEWDLALAADGDKGAEQRARKTLDAGLGLFDPAFNGVYQYSTHGDWKHPHYEKIMSVQAGYMRLYAIAGRQLNDKSYTGAAATIAQYLDDFLRSPEGGYYTSQDADLVQGEHAGDYFALDRDARLAKGLPRIDRHRYARENGMAIEAMVRLYQAGEDKQYLERALQAVGWVLNNRPLWGGGFRHDRVDSAGPYLGDTLAMGRAFIALYEADGDRRWLARAARAADFIDKQFRHAGGGLVSAVDGGTPLKPVPQIDENISAARFTLALASHTGQAQHRALAEHVMQYLVTPEVATDRITEAGILLADREYRALDAHNASAVVTN